MSITGAVGDEIEAKPLEALLQTGWKLTTVFYAKKVEQNDSFRQDYRILTMK